MKGGSHGGAAARAACLFLLLALTVAAATETRAARVPALQGAAALEQAQRAGIDIGAVIETVGHRVEPAKGRPGVLASEDRLYRAEFGAGGFSVSLREERASALRIETARVLRGGEPLAPVRTSWRGERNSALRTFAPALVERVTAREGRVEWDFVLDRPPAGRGALTIEARVSRAAKQRRRWGWSWSFPVGEGRSVAVGALVVKDARGRSLYRAAPGLAGRTLSLNVPARVLRGAAYPVTIDPVVSPEYPVSDPAYRGPAGTQWDSAVAFDGTNYLVAWSDDRSNPANSADIYAARVSPAGTVLDTAGIRIATVALYPSVAFDGTNCFVVWYQWSEGRIRGARVSPAGTVLDPSNGIALSTTNGSPNDPAVAFDGTNYLVVWRSAPGATGSDVYGTRVTTAGTVLNPNGIAISTAIRDQLVPQLAFDGTNYLVVWQDGRAGTSLNDVYGTRVSQAGTVLNPSGIAIAVAGGGYPVPAVAFDGTNYLVAWYKDYSGGGIRGGRVSRAGTALDPPGGFQISGLTNQLAYPVLAFDGTNYLVAWQGGCAGVCGTRVTPTANALDPSGIPISNGGLPAIAFGGTNYLVSFGPGNGPPSGGDVRGSRVTPAGTVLDGTTGFLVSTLANDQARSAVAFDGTNFLVVWQDFRAGSDVYGARISQAGALLDGTGIPISTASGAQFDPAVAFAGSSYLVVWDDQRSTGAVDIYGARVSVSGTLLDPSGIPISTAPGTQNYPAVAFDGSNLLAVWGDVRSGTGYDVYGARLTPAGAVLDPAGIPISTAALDQDQPGLAFDGVNYVVAWEDYRSGAAYDVYATRVSSAGSVLDPAGIPVTTAANDQQYPAVASDGTDSLVVWADDRTGGVVFDIYGARVSQAGTVLDPGGIAVSTAVNHQVNPALAFDGTYYLAAWQDFRSGAGPDIYGARVTRAGGVFDTDGISTVTTNELSPAVARGAGRLAVTYDRPAPETPYGGVERVFLRFVERYRPSHVRPTASLPGPTRAVDEWRTRPGGVEVVTSGW